MAATSTAQNSDQILVGSSGNVWVGTPSLVTAPTSEVSVLDTDLVQLGYLTEDGVTFRDSKEVAEIKAWQTPYAVRHLVTGRNFEITFALEQWNWETLPFALGGGTLTIPTANKYKYVPPDADDLDERSMLIDWVDGTKLYRLFIPRGISTDVVEVNMKRTEAAVFPITFAAHFDGTNPPYTIFSNDPAFQNA